MQIDPDFAYSDGNIEIQISGRVFWVHEFLLTGFTKLAELVRQAREGGELTADSARRTIICIRSPDKVQYIDFRRIFQVIYSSMNFVFNQVPPSFDTKTLVSTLRVATYFQNLDLRSFAIAQLESKKLLTTAIDRIALSDELELPDWEIPAFAELCRRPQPISHEEAKILGITRFVEIARVREVEQRRRYTELVDRVAKGPFLSDHGTVKKDMLQAAAQQTLKNSFPACKCKGTDSDAPMQAKPSAFGGFSGFSHQAPAKPALSNPFQPGPEAAPPKPTSAFGPSSFAFGAPRAPAVDLAREPSSTTLCQTHQLAPSIASESRALYKNLSDTLKRIETLKQEISLSADGLPGNEQGYSIENELKKANRARKTT